MSESAAIAQTPAPTAEEVVKPAPGIEKQDTSLTGSGEVTCKEEVATRDKPEEIMSPEEWLKNSKALNEKIVSEAKTDGVVPPVEAEEIVPPVETPAPVATTKPTEELEELEEEPVVPGEPKKSPQHRIRATNPVDDMALSLFNASSRNGGSMTLAEASKEAERLLGKAPASEAVKPAAQVEAPALRTDGKPTTIAETDAKIADLRAQRKHAKTVELNFDLEADLTDQIELLTEHKGTLRSEASEAEVRRTQGFDTEVRTAQTQAVQQFPDCAVKDSALVKEMIALDAEWKADGNANFHAPNKPLLLAQRASDRLKRLGVATSAPAAASPQPVKPARPVQPAAPIASGSTRTTQAAPQNGQLVEKLKQISSPADYEAAIAEAGGKRW